MCRIFAIVILLMGLLTAAAIFAIVKFIPSPWSWILLAAIPVLGVMAIWFGGKLAVRAIAGGLFGAKSGVLKDATAKIISVKPAAAPAKAEDSEEENTEDKRKKFFTVEATITPQPGSSPMQMWDTDDLTIVPFDAKKLSMWSNNSDDADGVCEIRKTEVRVDGAFVEPDGPKFGGEQTLRLLIAVTHAPARLKFRYYFEDFGDFKVG